MNSWLNPEIESEFKVISRNEQRIHTKFLKHEVNSWWIRDEDCEFIED